MTHGSREYILGFTPGSFDLCRRFNQFPPLWDFSNPLSEKDQANARNIAKFHYGLDVEPLGCITHLQDPTMGITPHILVQDKHGEKHILHTRYAELSEEAYQIGQKGFAAYKKEALSVQKLQRNTDDNFITSIMSPTGGKHYAYLTNYVEAEPSDPLNGNISYAELGKTVGIMRIGLAWRLQKKTPLLPGKSNPTQMKRQHCCTNTVFLPFQNNRKTMKKP